MELVLGIGGRELGDDRIFIGVSELERERVGEVKKKDGRTGVQSQR